ncbi:MAG TPA: Bax inhibitor-1/YccA family protein [Thermopolyspora sp.]
MASNNPVFARSAEFKSGGYATFDTRPGGQPGAQQTYADPRYGQAPQTAVGQPQSGQTYTPEQLEELYAQPAAGAAQMGRMTYDDVVIRTGMLFGILVATSVVGWMAPALMLPGALIGLVLGLVNSFKKSPSPALIIAYAAFEGLFIGGISNFFNNQWPGIVAQAVMATFAVFAVALYAFKSGRIRVTAKSTKIFMIALGGYLLFSLANVALSFFVSSGSTFGPLRPDGPMGFLIGVFAVGLAAYSLVMDFDFIQRGVQRGLPEKFAWFGAFGLIVTLVWLYVEMLRLIAILRGND